MRIIPKLVASLACCALLPLHAVADKPDFSGVWQVMSRANDNLEPHRAQAARAFREGPVVPVPAREVVALGAVGAVPAGLGVVEGGEIPYRDWAMEQRDENRVNALQRDPEVSCSLPGIPRATYMPYPFQIEQDDGSLLFSYAYAGASRTVAMDDPGPVAANSSMGQSRARWEGDTLVIETAGLNGEGWLDRSGNFYSKALRVTEYFTRSSDHTIDYRATLEDDKVFTRPWSIAMTLYRRVGPDARLLPFNCQALFE